MSKTEISISELRMETENGKKYLVDVNALLGVCGASPIRVKYNANEIIVMDVYPESIFFMSGENYIMLNQIQKIFKISPKDGKATYEILCGKLKSLETTVRITER